LRFIKEAFIFAHNKNIEIGKISGENIYFTKNGKAKIKIEINLTKKRTSNVFLTELTNFQSDFQSLAILIYNCLFGEKLSENEVEKIIFNLKMILNLKTQKESNDKKTLEEFIRKNPMLIVIMKHVDMKIVEFTLELLMGKFNEATAILQSQKLFEAKDGIYFNDLTTSELIKTIQAQESQALKNPNNPERIISTKFSNELLKLIFQQIFERFIEIQAAFKVENKGLYRNWGLVNERSVFIKEIGETLGLSRKKVFAVFQNSAAENGLLSF